MKAIILDFINVVADINYKKMIWDLPLKEKFSAIRIFLSLKKIPDIKYVFNAYQKGLINSYELEQRIEEFLPNSAYVVPKLLNNINNYINVNEEVLSLVKTLKQYGIKVVLLSNSIPETEDIMNKYDLDYVFDGMVLSNQIGMMKPQRKIYNHTLSTYDLNPEETLMIDDTKKNLIGANEVEIKTIQCKNSKQTCDVLNCYLNYLETSHQM